MMNPKPFQRRIAIILLAIFLPSLFPINLLYASNNGPNAFEAASFEPVDASDMVNLATGDLNYVLPLLNVPSPEGGYPLALSYKAGIAMDQEASWVGLGWSLNPGAINRNVNGYADDIEEGNEYTFIYDSGGQLNYYNVGIGGNHKGITLGVGAYWGSNKTFGGSVTFGVGPAVASIGAGSNGLQGGVGYANVLETTLSNFSNGVTFKEFRKQKGSGTGISNQGTGSFNSSSSYSQGDYDISVESVGFNSGFGIHYGHTKVKFSLFEDIMRIYSGILYPDFFANQGQSYKTYLSKSFDTDKLVMYKRGLENLLDANNFTKAHLYENNLLPNYDRYQLNAQGLSGQIKPAFTEELPSLMHLNSYKNDYWASSKTDGLAYFNYRRSISPTVFGDNNMKLNNKIFFEFENSNSSFLRVDRTNITRDLPSELSTTNFDEILFTAKTLNSNNFNENTSNEGIQLKNGNRKRVGKYIEAFTNNQILSNPSTITNFIEAKNLNRNNNEIYKPQSIGGFRVTDVDGKTYHYSLPVINFETWYKNYSIANNENDKFYEVESSEPYATDWLLTAVTGPDYVDINNNGTLDESDYGYWVEFDYGKWSDGYIWQSSSGKHDIIKGDVKNGDRYEFHRGRKQIYYLDAVRTRSHTAYFIKSLRKDAQGQKIEHFKNRVSSTVNYDIFRDANVYQSAYYENANPGYRFPENPQVYNIPSNSGNKTLDMYMGYKKNYSYKDFPNHYSLKLDKIVLVKNSNDILINKAQGQSLLTNTKAFYAKTTRMFQITGAYYNESGNGNNSYSSNLNGNHTIGINPVKEIDIHMSSNVLDVNDLNGLNINNNVLKVVNFEYDENYSLMPNSNNSVAISKGKLTLNAIDFLGKNATQHSPKYKFKYNIPSTEFNVSMEDGWGYHKTLPIAWSLNEITTPTGSKLKFDYESDDFSSVASLSSRIFSKGLSFLLTKNSTTNKLNFVVSRNNTASDNVIEDFDTFMDYFDLGEKISLDFFVCRRSYYGGSSREASIKIKGKLGLVTNVNSASVTFEIDNNQAEWHTSHQSDGWILDRIFSLTSVKHSNGNGDGVIMRNASYGECPDWRNITWPEEYGNDDVNFDYRLASTKTPNKGKSGGIRIKSISTYDNDILDSKQNYYYNLPNYSNNPYNTTYKSSGVTSYVPQNYPVIIPYASQLPSPFVMYKNVSVESFGKTNEVISKTEYVFETLDNFTHNNNFLYSLGNKLTMRQIQNESPITNVKLSKFEIKSQLSQLGRLLSVKNYNGNNQLLISKKYNYKNNLDNHGELGVKQESFVSRIKTITSNPSKYSINAITKIDYPNKLESTESTAGGYTSKTLFEKHDFLTGEVLETKMITSDGKVVKSKIVPAYTKLPYQQMGSKVDNANNHNMLSQTAATYSYIQQGTLDKVTGVGITTWSNIWSYQDVEGNVSSPTNDKEKIWRKHKSFVWKGVKDNNGIFLNYDDTNDDDFDWTVGVGQPVGSEWKQTSEITLYNHYSNPLEVKDINNNKAATKMDVLNQKVEANGNAAYNEMYFSGAEILSGGGYLSMVGQEVQIVNGSRTDVKAHTGKYSVATTNNSQFGVYFKNGHRPGKYKISVWVHKDNYLKARLRWYNNDAVNTFDFNNGEKVFAGDWVLLNHYTDVHYMDYANAYWYVNSVDNSTVYFDDLMIRPIASSITGYVYNEYDELTHIIGNNGLATRFEYDAAGRLIKTYVEIVDDPANNVVGGFKLKSQNRYNYKNL